MSVRKCSVFSFSILDDENENGHKSDKRGTKKMDTIGLSESLIDEMRNVTNVMMGMLKSKLKSNVRQDLKEMVHKMRHMMAGELKLFKYLQRIF